MTPKMLSETEWLAACKQHLSKEKEFTRRRDELSRQRRELPGQSGGAVIELQRPNGPKEVTISSDVPQIMHHRGGTVLFAQGFANRRQELAVVHRLLQESFRSGLERPVHICGSVASGHDNHRDQGKTVIGFQSLQDAEAIAGR